MFPGTVPLSVALPVAAALTLLAALLLALWLRASGRLRRLRADRTRAGASVGRLELALAEQGGRLRIVRELQELAVHRVATMVAQAEGAGYAGASDPQAAVRAAAGIAETGRATLADLRRVGALVRDGDAEAGLHPHLGSVLDLFTMMRDAGLDVSFEESGDAYDLDPSAQLAVHRILQEALANSLRYGGEGTQVRVAFAWTGAGLAVRIDDNGIRNAVLRRGLGEDETAAELAYGLEEDLRALTQEFDGAGLNEMRARTEVFGGSLTATEVPGVGFSHAATFPSIRYHNGVHGVDLSRR